jgi:hypothetical protein
MVGMIDVNKHSSSSKCSDRLSSMTCTRSKAYFPHELSMVKSAFILKQPGQTCTYTRTSGLIDAASMSLACPVDFACGPLSDPPLTGMRPLPIRLRPPYPPMADAIEPYLMAADRQMFADITSLSLCRRVGIRGSRRATKP